LFFGDDYLLGELIIINTMTKSENNTSHEKRPDSTHDNKHDEQKSHAMHGEGAKKTEHGGDSSENHKKKEDGDEESGSSSHKKSEEMEE
jgi:hypothetical protein